MAPEEEQATTLSELVAQVSAPPQVKGSAREDDG